MYAAYEALSERMKRFLEPLTAMHEGEHVYRGSDALLQFLFRHVETPEFHCRFRWQVNSLAFWDNRSVQHHAMWDCYPQRRHGHGVTVRGDRPF